MKLKNKVNLIVEEYKPEEFYSRAKGLEKEPEGGKRCFLCYELRMREAAIIAQKGGFDYFVYFGN